MELKDFYFFDITFQTMNLFSFVMGMFYAATMGYFGRKALTQVIIYFMILTAWYAGSAWIEKSKAGNAVVVDCRLSDISPDFTPKLKEQCREMRIKQANTGNIK